MIRPMGHENLNFKASSVGGRGDGKTAARLETDKIFTKWQMLVAHLFLG